MAFDGVAIANDGIAGFFGGASSLNAVIYNYGNAGLNGDGTGTRSRIPSTRTATSQPER